MESSSSPLIRFNAIRQAVACPFARVAKLECAADAELRSSASVAEQISAQTPALCRYVAAEKEAAQRNERVQKFDGFLLELTGTDIGATEEQARATLATVLDTLRANCTPATPTALSALLATSAPGLCLDGLDYYTTIFAPCYPATHARHMFGVSDRTVFVLLQSHRSFVVRGIKPDHDDMTRKHVRQAFVNAGRPYVSQSSVAEHAARSQLKDTDAPVAVAPSAAPAAKTPSAHDEMIRAAKKRAAASLLDSLCAVQSNHRRLAGRQGGSERLLDVANANGVAVANCEDFALVVPMRVAHLTVVDCRRCRIVLEGGTVSSIEITRCADIDITIAQATGAIAIDLSRDIVLRLPGPEIAAASPLVIAKCSGISVAVGDGQPLIQLIAPAPPVVEVARPCQLPGCTLFCKAHFSYCSRKHGQMHRLIGGAPVPVPAAADQLGDLLEQHVYRFVPTSCTFEAKLVEREENKGLFVAL